MIVQEWPAPKKAVNALTGGINGKWIDLVGKRYGRLTVVHYCGGSQWACLCDCGNKTVAPGSSLYSGRSTSCTCARNERVALLKKSHGLHDLPEYKIWKGINSRCEIPSASGYKNYGGRGISVCERWRHDFACFLADVGRRPAPNLSLDRINNNGNYEPSNCRWATRTQQNQNRRNTKWANR